MARRGVARSPSNLLACTTSNPVTSSLFEISIPRLTAAARGHRGCTWLVLGSKPLACPVLRASGHDVAATVCSPTCLKVNKILLLLEATLGKRNVSMPYVAHQMTWAFEHIQSYQ
eukprot:212148-Amphidinium_carterae.1